MVEAALTQLQTQIEAIRHEAFAEGYAAAMEAIRELSSRSVTQQDRNIPALKGRTDGEGQGQQPERRTAAIPLRTSSAARRSPARARSTRANASVTRTSRGPRQQRGTNARLVHAILKAASPRRMRQAEIRKALQVKGVSLAYPSIGHALGQLEARKAAKQVGKTKTWRYSAAG
jgi:hypothetical protein